MWSVQQNERGDRICLREKTSCSGDADLTTVEGIQKQVQMFTGISANTETIEATGKTLQLQIGDMHAEAPGLKDLKIDAGPTAGIGGSGGCGGGRGGGGGAPPPPPPPPAGGGGGAW